MAREEINIWKNGATSRLKNKEINFIEIPEKDGILIEFKFADKEAEKPSVKHKCLRGKVRVSEIALSHDAMESLFMAYMTYRKGKIYSKQQDK